MLQGGRILMGGKLLGERYTRIVPGVNVFANSSVAQRSEALCHCLGVPGLQAMNDTYTVLQ